MLTKGETFEFEGNALKMEIYSEVEPIIIGVSIQCVVLGCTENYILPIVWGIIGTTYGVIAAAKH